MICSTCVHTDDGCYCIECKNLDRSELLDLYEEASAEMIRQREADRLKRAEASCIDSWVFVEPVSDEFLKAFSLAKRIADPANYRKALRCAYAADNHLIASDGFLLIEIACPIPNALKRKCLVKVSKDRIPRNHPAHDGRSFALYHGSYPNYRAIFELFQNPETCTVTIPPADIESIPFQFSFSKEYITEMRLIMPGQITVSYISDSLDPVLFTGENGVRMVIAPNTKQGG